MRPTTSNEHAVLMVPGLHGSGPDHWQSIWQREHPEYRRVSQADWSSPQLDYWTAHLDRAVRSAGKPVVVAAHSFGCLALARRGGLDPAGILGALLVAPANPDKFDVTRMLPIRPLAFPTIVVASENDRWMPFTSAQWWAKRWGSRFVNLGAAGHINAESGFGAWPQGKKLFAELKSAALSGAGGELDSTSHGHDITIHENFGGSPRAQQVDFNDGGVFDQVYASTGKEL